MNIITFTPIKYINVKSFHNSICVRFLKSNEELVYDVTIDAYTDEEKIELAQMFDRISLNIREAWRRQLENAEEE